MSSADSKVVCVDGRGDRAGEEAGERGWETGERGRRWRERGERGMDSGERGDMSEHSSSVLTERERRAERSWFSRIRSALSS